VRIYVDNGLGDHLDDPSVDQMRAFLAGVDETDEEHGAAWLSTDDGDSLEWSAFGMVYSRRGSCERPRHMRAVSRERALELWLALAEGRLDDLERCDWRPQGEIKPDPEHEANVRAWQAQQDREFYDGLGEERVDVPCRAEACTRGAVRFSVFCRAHHFESVKEAGEPGRLIHGRGGPALIHRRSLGRSMAVPPSCAKASFQRGGRPD
jgi:hypothetical protein